MNGAHVADISVIIPAYNAAFFLQDAIDSVVAQTRPAREIIIVNDGSRDATLGIARRNEGVHPAGPRIVVVDQKNAGVSVARNKGAARAEGRYLAFMDADDVYLPDFLAEAERAMEVFPDSVGFFGNQIMFDERGDRPGSWFDGKAFSALPATEKDGIRKPEQSLFTALLAGNFVPPSASVVARDVAMAVGLFDPGITTSEDRDFFCRIALFGSMVYTLKRLSRARLHDSNVSFTTGNLTLAYNCLRVVQKFYHSRWSSYMTDAERQAVVAVLEAARKDYRYFASKTGLFGYLSSMKDAASGFSLDSALWRDLARAMFAPTFRGS